MLAVRIPQSLEQPLERLSQKKERSKSYYVRKVLESFLAHEEEKQIAHKAYEAYQVSGGKVYTLEDVLKENGL